MNKSLLLTGVAILFLFTGKSFGQATTSGTATLNITLSSVLSLVVTQPPTLDVNFNTIDKYQDGIPATADNHLKITSSRGYTISAVAGDLSTNNPSSLSAASIKLTATLGSATHGDITSITYVSNGVLDASTALPVVTAPNSSSDGINPSNSFKVVYNIGSGAQYLGKTLGVNAIPILYTVVEH